MTRRIILLLIGWTVAPPAWAQEGAPGASPFAGFVEADFPFITTTVDARDLAPALPDDNVAVRCIAAQLGHDAYSCFDPDLLRMAVAWEADGAGDFLTLTTMAQVSYQEAGNKGNQIPRVLGRPIAGTGLYPGWTAGPATFTDPRPAGPNPDDAGRGPLPETMGTWDGLYTVGDGVVLRYTVGGASIYEQPSSVRVAGALGIVRSFRVGPSDEPLTLVAAEVGDGAEAQVEVGRAFVYHGPQRGAVTAVGLLDAPSGARLEVVEDRYVTVHLPPQARGATFGVVLWKGAADRLEVFEALREAPPAVADVSVGHLAALPARWPQTVTTRGTLGTEVGALAVDRIALPIPNPWRRNVRVADVDFFEDGSGRAAVVTFEGDVWLLDGLGGDLDAVTWRRFASGLYEAMSLRIVDGEIYVFGREGIVRVHDRDADGEADFYERFSNRAIQSAESREFPLSMVEKPGGGFYLGKGAALDMGPKTSPRTMPGFRAGAPHSGTVLEVTPDGEAVRVVATGLREPYLGVHPRTGLVTASDQQGNFVPTTPLYVIRPGGYYGVPATAHREAPPEPTPPVTWIPHEVDPSGAEQVWATDARMGPLAGSLVHLSYGRPTAYRILLDSLGRNVQGGVLPLPVRFPGPVMKGQMHPDEGLLYLTGFQVWGTQAEDVSGFYRLRPTGEPLLLPTAVEAGAEGLILHFNAPLTPEAAEDAGAYTLRRWNYERSPQYGSGHFRLDGSAGQEALPVADAQRSRDGRAVFLAVPDMRPVMQMAVGYRLASTNGAMAADTLHLTVNALEDLNLDAYGFTPVDPAAFAAATVAEPAEPAAGVPPTAERGAHLVHELGCIACHSTDGTMAGKLGPSFYGLYGASRTFTDGTTREADEAYIHQAILDPSSQIVEGFVEGMPVYRGILSESDVQAITRFIQSLSGEEGP